MSIVKESTTLKKALLDRLKELYPSNNGGYKGALVIQDALERKFKIAPEQLSRYFSEKAQKNTLSENQILWLSIRYGIDVRLKVEVTKFDEANALHKLKLIFG